MSVAGLDKARTCSSWCASSSWAACRKRWASFSAPSKHRKAPPSISSGVMAQGATALMSSAAGTRMALLMSEPLATAHTTGSSRSVRTPVTCCAFSARSSPSTPAVFLAATLVITATSSMMVAMSSISVSRLAPAMGTPWDYRDWEAARIHAPHSSARGGHRRIRTSSSFCRQDMLQASCGPLLAPARNRVPYNTGTAPHSSTGKSSHKEIT